VSWGRLDEAQDWPQRTFARQTKRFKLMTLDEPDLEPLRVSRLLKNGHFRRFAFLNLVLIDLKASLLGLVFSGIFSPFR